MLKCNKYAARLALIFVGLLMSCAPSLYRDGWFVSGKDRDSVADTAMHYIGVPYRYGGASPSGFDCSGFTMYVYKKHGINLPRSAKKQYLYGRKVTLRNARRGDLVFFKTSSRTYSHVGIYLGRYRFVHAPSSGKHVSVADMKNDYWRSRFRGAVSYLKKSNIAHY